VLSSNKFLITLHEEDMIQNENGRHPPQSIQQRPCVVACLGSSSTAGKGQAFNWVAELQQHLTGAHYVIENFGVGGDLAYNALQRLPGAIACQPRKIIVFIGGNDALALVSRKALRFFQIFKRLPCEPTPEWFRTNLRAIVRRCKAESSAEIALCSLPPIGEDPASSNHFQSELNRRIEELSVVIRDIAFEEDVGYIPLHEALLEQIKKSAGRPLTEFRLFPFYRDAFRTLVLRKTPDEVARMNGWRFHTDGVHLNSRSGLLVADLVQRFIENTQ
jgi:lysophospholipase L1-like esterase